MMHSRTIIITGLVVAASIAGYFAFWARDTPDFKFTELASPPGFRTLVQKTQSSSVSSSAPLFGLTPQTIQPELRFCDTLFNDSSSPVLGPAAAKVNIVEFFDYRCPYCRVLREILFQIKEERPVRIIYKEWPILSEGSKLAARAALGAANQGKYFEFHMRFMKARFLTTQAYVKSVAAKYNIDKTRLLRDMNGPQITDALKRNAARAIELGLIGTPGLVVGRTIVQGAISKEKLVQLIDEEIASPPAKLC